MPNQFKLSNREKIQTKKGIDLLNKSKSGLIEKINQTLLSLAYENRFTLHPRRLKELGAEEIEGYRKFLQSLNTEAVIKHGKERAHEGLGELPLLSLCNILRQFCFDCIKVQDEELLKTATKTADIYIVHYLLGYMNSRIDQTLSEQEELRKALSKALDSQRRELFIKNHAIHTYINGIMLTDLEGVVTYINPAFLKMWQYDNADEVLNLHSIQFLGAEDFNFIMNALRTTGGWQNEFVASRNKDSSSFDLAISSSLIRDDTNQPIGIMTSFVDITEKKRLESQFRQSQKMEALGQLAGGIVHDFNNLLQIISGYTSLELMQASRDSHRYNNLMQIQIATERGKGLTKQLRFFTRQETGKAVTLSLNDVVKETHNLLKHTFQPDIIINLKLDPNLRPIKADPSQMSQLLMNLCVNARDAMINGKDNRKRGSERKTSQNILSLETYNLDLDQHRASRYLNAKPGRYVCVKVSDTGVGMRPELIERLFEPFFTTKSEKTGIGLGLSVVYGIVRNHNGFFDVRSKMGEGSNFEIYLPVLERAVKDSASKEGKLGLIRGRGTVLVVEDEEQVRNLVGETLKQCGYNALYAEDGVEALSIYNRRKDEIDLIVLDVIMPKMGGRECFNRLKEINPSVKVLIMTGYTANGTVQDFLKEGANDVIIKPFNIDTFTKFVKKILSI